MRFGPPRRGTHHAAQGATAKRAGTSFERELQATADAYAAMGLATGARAHPPVGGPPHALFYAGKGKVDWVFNVLGVPVAFDQKSNTGQASYKHDERDDHELDFLLDWRRTRGVSFLLLRDADTLYLVEDLVTLRARGTVALRTHARGKSLPVPIVPALRRTESERTLDAALGRPVWPWLELAAQISSQLATALTSHQRDRAS